MKQHLLAVLGFVVATFATQATSHFVLFAQHYAAVPYIRGSSETIFALGILVMIIQGTVMSFVFVNSRLSGKSIFHAVMFAWLLGAFFVSYTSLGEPAKYAVPSIPSWIAVELLSGFVQFTLAGMFLGLAHRGRTAV